MKRNRGVVQVFQNVYAKCVYDAMGDENCSVDPDCPWGCWGVGAFDGGSCRDQTSKTERDTCRDSHLTEEVEPCIELVAEVLICRGDMYQPVIHEAKAECFTGASKAAQ